MKRIVNGHYADPTSTRTLSEISTKEFEVVKDSIVHIKKKYNILIEMSDDDWKEMMQASGAQLSAMSLDEFAMSGETMMQGRKALKRDADIVSALEARIILLALSNRMNEMSDLSNDEFRVLIDAIRHTCVDFSNLVNSSREELLEQAKKINKLINILPEEKLGEGLDKITTEEHIEKVYQKTKVLYSILETINQPYEGAEYLDSDGSKIEMKKSNQPSIN